MNDKPAQHDSKSSPITWLDWVVLGLVIGSGTLLRLAYFDQPMRADEAYTYTEFASHTAYDAISLYTFPNNHLFHTLLVHIAVKLFGPAPWVIRMPALLAGIALIPATFALVRMLADTRSGLLSAALVAASDTLVSYSANARGYTMLCLITVLLILSADRIVSEGKTRNWTVFVILPALGFFTIPIMLYPMAGVVCWIGLRRMLGFKKGPRLDRLFAALFASGVLTLTLYVPTFLRTGVGSVVSNSFVKPRTVDDLRRELPASLAVVWDQWNLDIPRLLAFGFIAVWAFALILPSPGRRGVRAMTGLTLTLFVISLAIVFCQRVIPFDRVWIFLAPLYLGTMATALSSVLAKGFGGWPLVSRSIDRVLPMTFAIGFGLLVWRSPAISLEASKLTVNEAPALVRRLARELKSNDAVISELPCDGPLRYYLMMNGLGVELLHDYRIKRASRLFLVVNRPNGQTANSVLEANQIGLPVGRTPQLVEDFGRSALYVIEAWFTN